MFRLIAILCLAAWAFPLAHGQSADIPAPSPHGWVVIEDPIEFTPRSAARDRVDLEDRTAEQPSVPAGSASVLLHVPPRVPVPGATPAPDLRVARVARLSQSPRFVVAAGERVYAIMPADERGVHRVGRSRVYPRGLRDLWGADPARRLEVLPAIDASVVAASTDGSSPVVVTRTDSDRGATLGLRRLEGSEWAAFGSSLAVRPDAEIGVVWRGAGAHVVEIDAQRVVWHAPADEGWTSTPVAGFDGVDPGRLRLVGDWGGELIALAESEGGPAQVVAIASDRVRSIGGVPEGAWASAAIIADPGRLVLVATGAEATEDAQTALPSPGLKQRSVTIAEISLITGATLAMGDATASSPVSRGEFQSLALLLVAAMIVVLVVVVRPSPASAEPVLPPGTAIAPPGRRLAASLADLAPSLVVTGMLLDITLLETLGPIALPATGSVDIVPLVMVLAMTAMHSAAGEMLTGRSIGKMLTGTFVARVDPVPGATPEAGRFRPPTPGGAILRNVLKWFLFPATAIVLSDPSGRHRGDLIAKSAVLLPVPLQD